LNDNSQEWDFQNRDFTMKFTRINEDVGRIFFVDANGKNIPIPQDLILTSDAGVIQLPFQNAFFITWFTNYTLLERGVILCQISNERQQSLHGALLTDGRTFNANGLL
jgi:hypothetical protein